MDHCIPPYVTKPAGRPSCLTCTLNQLEPRLAEEDLNCRAHCEFWWRENLLHGGSLEGLSIHDIPFGCSYNEILSILKFGPGFIEKGWGHDLVARKKRGVELFACMDAQNADGPTRQKEVPSHRTGMRSSQVRLFPLPRRRTASLNTNFDRWTNLGLPPCTCSTRSAPHPLRNQRNCRPHRNPPRFPHSCPLPRPLLPLPMPMLPTGRGRGLQSGNKGTTKLVQERRRRRRASRRRQKTTGLCQGVVL